mgnify:CR=1 FL=1
MSTEYVTQKQFDELLARIKALEDEKSNEQGKKSPKKEPISLAGLIESFESGKFVCTHCYKTGANKNKFCASVTKLHYSGNIYTGNITVDKEDYFRFRCSQHVKGSTNTAIDLGKKMIEKHYGQGDEAVVAGDEEEPSQTVASMLTGNPIDVPTTPSKAKHKVTTDYIDQGDFLDEKIILEDGKNLAVIRHTKTKKGTPSKRSPKLIGVCELPNSDDYLNHLTEPGDALIASIGIKYKPIIKEKNETKEDEEGEEESHGLTKVKHPVVPVPEVKHDTYENSTEEEDDGLDKLLEDLK